MAKKKKPAAAKPVSPIELAAPVSRLVQIKDVRVVELAAACSENQEKFPSRIELGVTATARWNEGDDEIVVFVDGNLAGKDDGEDSASITIRARFRLAYEVKSAEGLKKKNVDAFGRTNGIYNAWPYWRELVHSTMTRMGLPPVVLPVFRAAEGSIVGQKSSRSNGKRKSS